MIKKLILELDNSELRVLWSALNLAQSNGMMGLERFEDVNKKFPQWELETLQELITLQKIKDKINETMKNEFKL